MKNVFVLLLVALMAFSCGSTKDVDEATDEGASTHVRKQAPRALNKEKRRGSIDAEQLAAQLGLAEDQEDLFIEMWNKTTADMRKARADNKGDKKAMISAMQDVKAQRTEGLSRILTDNQLDLYYEIMTHNRGKVDGTLHKRKG